MKSPSKEKSENSKIPEIELLNAISDSESHQVIEEVAKLLAEDNNLVADSAVEKQILAFSNRQLSKKDSAYVNQEAIVSQLQFVGTLNPKQWWRKLALPSFVVSGFVLTVLAFQTFWQPLFKNVPPRYGSEARLELAEEKKNKQTQIDLVTDGSEPTYVTKGFIDASALPEENEGKVNRVAKPLQSQNIYTGSELSRAEHPEREIWMQRIVKLFRESKNKQATKELKSFKQVYPNYPIKEKIKPYLH